MNAKFLWATIPVKSIETSLTFYRDFLGLTLERRFKPYPALELCFLKDENGIEIELLQHLSADPASETPQAAQEVKGSAYPTLGFQIQDLNASLEACKARGIEILNGPMEGGGVKFFFVKDPDGVSVQFVQKL